MNGAAIPVKADVRGRVKTLSVTLANPQGVYRPGDRITGTVVLELMEDTPVYGVRVWFYGTADVLWNEMRSNTRGGRFQYERYFKDFITLFGSESLKHNDHEIGFLVSGRHSYKFEYTLPAEIPSSFDMEPIVHARVQYVAKVQLESPIRGVNTTSELCFYVLRPLDLKEDAYVIKGPVDISEQKRLGCLCFVSGVIQVNIRLDKNGYVPGETMHIDIELVNNSTTDVGTSYVTFEQYLIITLEMICQAGQHHTTVLAQGSTRTFSACIFSISGATIKPGDTGQYHDVIHIPPVAPSRLDRCRLIDIMYMIHVKVEPVGIYSNFSIDVPIIIGTEPLGGAFKGKSEVIPCYATFDYLTGDISEHCQTELNSSILPKARSVYKYYKTVHIMDLPNEIKR